MVCCMHLKKGGLLEVAQAVAHSILQAARWQTEEPDGAAAVRLLHKKSARLDMKSDSMNGSILSVLNCFISLAICFAQ